MLKLKTYYIYIFFSFNFLKYFLSDTIPLILFLCLMKHFNFIKYNKIIFSKTCNNVLITVSQLNPYPARTES